jgi:hypothetical protein
MSRFVFFPMTSGCKARELVSWEKGKQGPGGSSQEIEAVMNGSAYEIEKKDGSMGKPAHECALGPEPG